MGSDASGVIWIVVITTIKLLLIKSTNTIYCLSEQVDNVLKYTAEKFRAFVERDSREQTNEYFSQVSD